MLPFMTPSHVQIHPPLLHRQSGSGRRLAGDCKPDQRYHGWNFEYDDVDLIGVRAHTIKKAFNIREGWKPQTMTCHGVGSTNQ